MSSQTISVVVRFHNKARLYELERALLSLMTQTYLNVEVIIVTQRFDASDIALVTQSTAQLCAIDPTFDAHVHNFADEHPQDARSALLNLGIERARGRYLAFLDYDDVMQPYAYAKLIAVIAATNVAIAFGGIAVKFATLESDYCLVHFRKPEFMTAAGLQDLFAENHCPIHSFVIDRDVVQDQLLHFETAVQRAEDYQFLLRICARYTSDFSLKTTCIGDYYIKDDGSNTVVTTDAHPTESSKVWRLAAKAIDNQRNQILIAETVQKQLKLSPTVKSLSISSFISLTKAPGLAVCSPRTDSKRPDVSISESATGLSARSDTPRIG